MSGSKCYVTILYELVVNGYKMMLLVPCILSDLNLLFQINVSILLQMY